MRPFPMVGRMDTEMAHDSNDPTRSTTEAMSDEELKRHIAKMEAIHGDEPIRIKMALAWAKELLELRERVKLLEDPLGQYPPWAFQ